MAVRKKTLMEMHIFFDIRPRLSSVKALGRCARFLHQCHVSVLPHNCSCAHRECRVLDVWVLEHGSEVDICHAVASLHL